MSSNQGELPESIDGLSQRIAEAIDGVGNEIGGAFRGDALLDGFQPNIVSAISELADATNRAASAITPNVGGSEDASGGHVASLTEAVMGTTAGLCRIADALDRIADAVKCISIRMSVR